MTNKKIAQILNNISKMLEIKEASRFRVMAYERAAKSIKNLGEDVIDIHKRGELEKIEGVGESIARKISELIKTGKCKYYEELKKKVPLEEINLTNVPGIGPRMAEVFYKKLKINNIAGLEKAAREGKISKLPNFQEKTELNILKGIQQLRKHTKEKNRMLLSFAEPIAMGLVESLENKCDSAEKCNVVGSLRRMKETIGDIDIVVGSEFPKRVVDCFVRLPSVKRIIASGRTKASVLHKQGVRVDLEVLPLDSYGNLLHHFTGSKEHNIRLRTWARSKGLKISEYGVLNVKTGKLHKFRTEKDFFKFLGMQYIEPELRTDTGEIEAAFANKLPKLIKLSDIKGDLHNHTYLSDGSNKPEELAMAAIKKGYRYLGISDHTKGLGVASGLDEKQLLKEIQQIKRVNKRFRKIHLFTGAEVNIKADGNLDINKEVLKKLDIVVASVHSSFSQLEGIMTKRIIKAIKNPLVNIIGHPSGRIIGEREPYDVDWPEVFKAAAKYKVALEINSFPDRLDLKDILIKEAKKYGVKFAIDTDSHKLEHLDNMRYGVAMARRGWAEKKDIINAMNLNRLKKWLKK